MKERGFQKHRPIFEFDGGVHLHICGNRQVDFEGCRGVVEYSDESIKINTGRYIVAFKGRGLHIRCMNKFGLVIEGFILSIEYIM